MDAANTTRHIDTTRFGPIDFAPADVIDFPEGLIGIEQCRSWLLLVDGNNEALGWLQSTESPELAVAVIGPRRVLADYQLRLSPRELSPVMLDEVQRARVLVIVGRAGHSVTLNLKAPLVINAERRIGRQVIANGEAPLRHELTPSLENFRKSA